MNVLNFLLSNWDSIVFVALFVVLLIILARKNGKDIVYKILYTLVTEAEKQYGGGTGALKQSAVINWVYERLPAIVKIFITAKTLEKWVDEVVEQAKAEWAKNSNIKEYIKSGPTVTVISAPTEKPPE